MSKNQIKFVVFNPTTSRENVIARLDDLFAFEDSELEVLALAAARVAQQVVTVIGLDGVVMFWAHSCGQCVWRARPELEIKL